MKRFTRQVHKINVTVKIFVLCFVVYYIGNLSK